ncbi:peptide chain release factor N(5)-glutamine methyltransferase [Magnetofaba australis]|uniref:Release factor glutamine methyltransferase n=1 Tax=Magnetofaba australis IT-1 TaxID=1434232 RepID=A0A1Y2JYX3_9PROT|nr:peptide chain release factor N(5)-glutamine methyltransferase [Magnetofaba australis]OSM00100.1 putative HemK family modification methylase [Magnetofaba australis IT-1]
MTVSTPEIWTFRTLIQWTTQWLTKQGIVDNPRLDAELLLAHALKLRRLDLFLDPDRPLHDDELNRYKVLIKKRASREPVAYILGSREFWSLTFRVGPGVLIPRPETETLVERILEGVADREATLRILDVGVGSGAILCALLDELPNATGVGVDRAAEALACARSNVDALDLVARAEIVEGDLFSPFNDQSELFDVIVSNPPYIASAVIETLEPEVRDHEPRGALDGGADGLACYRALIPASKPLLKSGGLLALEIGYDQGEAIFDLCREAGFAAVSITQDHARRDRVITATA